MKRPIYCSALITDIYLLFNPYPGLTNSDITNKFCDLGQFQRLRMDFFTEGKGTRGDGKNLLAVPRVKKLTFRCRSFKSISSILWNSLPLRMRLETNFKTFKKLLKTHLFNLAYGS